MLYPKKSAEPIVGALITFTSEWDKDVKYQRKSDAEGFRVVLPQGGYVMTIEAAGYESYILEIEVDNPHIDLTDITLLTVEQAAERDAKRKKIVLQLREAMRRRRGESNHDNSNTSDNITNV